MNAGAGLPWMVKEWRNWDANGQTATNCFLRGDVANFFHAGPANHFNPRKLRPSVPYRVQGGITQI